MGRFVVIESIDAAGGSTQADLLTKRLKKHGWQPQRFHFPQADQPTGEVIYQKFLLHKNKRPFSRREQALLYIQDFFAGSRDIAKALEKPKAFAISDRYCTSTMAYQTIGLSGKPRTTVLEWIKWLCWQGSPQLPKPDRVLFLDLPVSLSLKRLSERGGKKDYFENKQKQEAIRRSYLKLAKEEKWAVISCAEQGEQLSREEIHGLVWRQVENLLG